jgi:hypothetical protein
MVTRREGGQKKVTSLLRVVVTFAEKKIYLALFVAIVSILPRRVIVRTLRYLFPLHQFSYRNIDLEGFMQLCICTGSVLPGLTWSLV